MVSAGTAYKLAFGVDRSPIPWSDIAAGGRRLRRRRQRRRVLRRSRPTTSGGCATAAARLIVADPRDDADRPQRRPLPAGAARAPTSRCSSGMLHVDPARRPGATATSSPRTRPASRPCAASVRPWDPPRARRELTGVPPDAHRDGRALDRRGRRAPCCCTRAASSTRRKGVDNVPRRCINLALATGNIGRPGCGLHDDHRPGQRPGRPRARPEVRPAPRPALASTIPAAREHVARRLGRSPERDPAGRATPRSRSWRRSTAARSRGCCRSASTRWCRCPTPRYIARGARASSSSSASSTSSSPRPRSTPTWCSPGSLQEEDEGTSPAAPRAAWSTSSRRSTPPGEARARLGDLLRAGAPPRHGASSSRSSRRARSSTSCARPRAAASPTTPASPTRRSTRSSASSGPARARTIPGTPRLFEGGRFFHPDGKARFLVAEYRAERRPGRRRVSRSPHHRPRRHPVPVAAPRRGASARWSTSTRSRASRSIRGWPASSASPTATG